MMHCLDAKNITDLFSEIRDLKPTRTSSLEKNIWGF